MFNLHPKRHHSHVASSALARLALWLVDTRTYFLMLTVFCDGYLRSKTMSPVLTTYDLLPMSCINVLFMPYSSDLHLYA